MIGWSNLRIVSRPVISIAWADALVAESTSLALQSSRYALQY